MAQHDYVIANGTGAAVRSDLNNALAAIVSQNSGATAPATTYAFQFWADTTAGVLKLRNSANSAWITLFQLDGEWTTLPVENGTAAAPSIYFKDSGTDTGFYSPGTDQVAISTGGTGRLFINSSGSVGIGTSSPSTLIHGTVSSGSAILRLENTANSGESALQLYGKNSGGTVRTASIKYDNTDYFRIGTPAAVAIAFETSDTERLRITSAGNVGIGTATPGTSFHVRSGSSGGTAYALSTAVIEGSTYGYLDIKGTGACGVNFGDAANSQAGVLEYDHGSDFMRFIVNGAEAARIDSSRRLLVGTSNNNNAFDSAIQIAGNGSAGTQLITAFNNNTNGAELYLAKSRSGTVGTNTIVQSGDRVGFIGFYGADGTTYRDAARIEAFVDGTPGSADMPGRLVFSTTADGASSPTERMRISNHGGVVINRALNDSNLKFYIQGEDTGSTKYAIYIDNSSFANLFRIRNDGVFYTGTAGSSPYNLTTASAANLHCDSNGIFYRSTSSGRFKTDVEVINDSYSDALLNLRPVWYRSTAPGDAKHADWSYWGFIAEEVAEIDPRLVFWKTHETIKIDSGSSDVLDKEEEVELETPIAEGVQYDRFVPHLLNLIKRQKEQIEALEARLTALESA